MTLKRKRKFRCKGNLWGREGKQVEAEKNEGIVVVVARREKPPKFSSFCIPKRQRCFASPFPP